MSLRFKEYILESLEDIQKLDAKILRALLRSHSENSGGTKADLVLKVYAILKRDVIPINQNSNSANTAGTNIEDFTYKTVMQHISPLGWSTDLRQLPELSFIQLYDYLVVSTRKYRHIVLKGTNYKKLRAYQFFFEGHVKSLESKDVSGKQYVKAQVLASMKKQKYNVVVELSTQGDILRATCTCPAGLSVNGKGKCNHVGGVLFAMEDFCRRGLKQHPEPLSCTSRLSVWVVPRNQCVSAKPQDSILIRKIKFGKDNIRNVPKIISFDPRAHHQRCINEVSLQGLSDSLKDCLPSSMFFLFHNKAVVMPGNPSLPASTPVSFEQSSTCPFNDSYDIASSAFKDMMNKNVQNLTITNEKIKQVEIKTRGQANNNTWKEERKKVLTASNFGNIVKTKVEPSKKLKSMLYSSFQTEATIYGKESEAKAVKLYLDIAKSKGESLVAEEPGLIISKHKPFLGASLDRIITDRNSGDKWGLEVKSRISKCGMDMEEACRGRNFCLRKLDNGTFQLKRNSNYYFQVQGQLFVSTLHFVDFVVYFGEDKPLYIERITLDQTSWKNSIVPKLEYFYKRALLPELLTERVKRQKTLYLHGGWVPYSQNIKV